MSYIIAFDEVERNNLGLWVQKLSGVIFVSLQECGFSRA